MNKKIMKLLILPLVVIVAVSLGFKAVDSDDKNIRKTNVNDDYNYIAINQILMWVSNNGDGSHDPRTGGNGFYWPGGKNATQSAIFEDGLIFGGKIGREIRVNGNTHRQGLQAGKILPDGRADDPSLAKYRVFKIKKGWESLPPGPERDQYEADYNEWPVEDGAPWVDVDGDGIYTFGVDQPHFIGDEVLWYVANDMDPARSTRTYGTLPMGLEFQTTIFGFNRTGPLGDMVFKKYKMINKGSNTVREMVLGYWSDTDLGDANDDYTGCDTVLSLGYTYNGTNVDGIYGTAPPAVGYDFFQGPIVRTDDPADSAKFDGKWRHGYVNLPMTAFTFYINPNAVYRDPSQGVAAGSIEFYYYLTGYVWNGNPFIDPNTGQETKFVLAGDPVAGTGWYEGPGWPGGPAAADRRHLMASGPFTLAPGDTQEVVVGILIAKGSSNINSITQLKSVDRAAQIAYDLDFQLTPAPPNPTLYAFPEDKAITLWWETNAESYNEVDPLIVGQGYSDTTFNFEGYRIWQFRDLAGTDPVLLATYDLVNGITDIEDVVSINGKDVSIPVINGTDSGLKRFIRLTQNKYTNGQFFNGNPYYFAVTAYGYSPNSSPKYLESPPAIIEVLPGTPRVDITYNYPIGSSLVAPQVSGTGEGTVRFKVIDPDRIKNDTYEVVVLGTSGVDLRYHVINTTTGDTLLRNQTDFTTDSTSKPIVEGFIVIVSNVGQDQLNALPANQQPFGIKRILEVKGPGGANITPVNVVTGKNSTNQWQITSTGTYPTVIANINKHRVIGFNDFEIRFTAQGSEYYTTGYAIANPETRDNPKAVNPDGSSKRVPFEIWDVGRYVGDAPKRMYIKTFDNGTPKDSTFSQRGTLWDGIFAYTTAVDYNEPIANLSGTTPVSIMRLNNIIIDGSIPAEGTVIRIETWKPLGSGDVFRAKFTAPNSEDVVSASQKLENITVFPNPYFGANSLERDKYQRFVRFTNMPTKATVRIFSLSGVFIQRIEKDNSSPWLDWDLRNRDGLPVASGIYLAYLDLPGIGTKVMKIAVIMETQFIDRL